MHLYVLPPDGKVRISVPLSISDDAIGLFAVKNIGWIKRQVDNFNQQLRQTEREYISGESHYLWGRRYKMEVLFTNRAYSIEIKGNKMLLKVRKNSTCKQRESFVNEWYRAELKAKLPAILAKWEKIVGVKASGVGVKSMKTRWGTCNNQKKRIWLNLQLAKKPVVCLEYIIVHELIHLKEKNHTQAFIEHMDAYLPHWRTIKDELNSFILDKYIES